MVRILRVTRVTMSLAVLRFWTGTALLGTSRVFFCFGCPYLPSLCTGPLSEVEMVEERQKRRRYRTERGRGQNPEGRGQSRVWQIAGCRHTLLVFGITDVCLAAGESFLFAKPMANPSGDPPQSRHAESTSNRTQHSCRHHQLNQLNPSGGDADQLTIYQWTRRASGFTRTTPDGGFGFGFNLHVEQGSQTLEPGWAPDSRCAVLSVLSVP